MSDIKKIKSIAIIGLMIFSAFFVVFVNVGETVQHIVVDHGALDFDEDSLGTQGQRALARASDGTLYVVYNKATPSPDRIANIYISESDNNGSTWSETKLTDEAWSQKYPTIAIDSEDKIYVFWDGYLEDFTHQIRYMYYDGTWSEIFNATNSEYGQYRPSIAIDENDIVHAVWLSESDEETFMVRYANSSDWAGVVDVAEGPSELYGYFNPSIAISEEGGTTIVHFVWQNGDFSESEGADYSYIQYRETDGIDWSGTMDVSTQDGSESYFHELPSIIINSTNFVHIIWSNVTIGGACTDIEHCSYGLVGEEKVWSAIEKISSDSADYPDHKVTATSFSRSINGTSEVLHAIWATNTEDEFTNPTGTIISYRNYTSSWSALVNSSQKTNKTHPYLLYANFPDISGINPNIPKEGYAYVYLEGYDWTNGTAENITYHPSNDLAFDSPSGVRPSLSNENPADGSANVDIYLTKVQVTISDGDGDLVDWMIGGTNITTNSSINDATGIKNASVHGTLGYATTYSWWINVSDDDGFRNETYTFTTVAYHADIVYVDDDFSPSTPGWNLTKYDSIGDAIVTVNASGIIYVYPGTYNENIIINKMINVTGIAGSYGINRDSIIINGTGSGNTIRITANKVNLSYLRIQNGNYGIYLDKVNNGSIVGCNITDNNRDGIYFLYSNDTLIKDNNLTNNGWAGLNITDLFDGLESHGNVIYHNNFMNNGVNVIGEFFDNIWNTSYPYGGNYWDDHYWFVDVYSGLAQNYTGSDGISDQEHDISRVTWDYYPLMMPWLLGNHPPYVWNSNPKGGTVNIPINQASVQITIQDLENNPIHWTLESSHSTRVNISGATNGVKTVPLTLPLPYFTTITWYVNATDGNSWTRHAFTFETVSQFSGTIQAAINAAAPGGTIFVYKGHFIENLVINKEVTLIGEDEKNTTIDAGGAGDAISITSDDVLIENFTITNSGLNNGPTYDSGIDARNRDNITIENCNVSGNNYGIYFHTITNSNITNNTFSNNKDGIHGVLFDSSDIEGNDIYSNTQDGINIETCSHLLITNNTIHDDARDGIRTAAICEDNIYTNNIVRSHAGNRNMLLQDDLRPIISRNQVSEALYGMILYSCKSGTVDYNSCFSNTFDGMDLWDQANDMFIRGNNFSGNTRNGLRIYVNSLRNQVYENEFYGTDFLHGIPNAQGKGLYIEGFAQHSSDNLIFHNNFYGNVIQVQDDETTGFNTWNDTYPSGGNYFDDFYLESQGAYDHFQGPNQDIIGADGIVDSHSPNPYHVPGGAGSLDNYPLAHPWAQTLQADFDYTPRNPQTNQKISFWDVSKGFVVSYVWSFGDGSSATGRSVSHIYTRENFYMVTLRVTDNRGVIDIVSKVLSVGSNVVSIPPLQPPKYPNKPFTVPEMYQLMRADVKSDAKIVIVVIDSGTTSRTYDSVDMSRIISMQHPVYFDGEDAFGHGTWVNYCVQYGIQAYCPNVVQYSIKAFDEKGSCAPATFLGALDLAKSLNPDVVTISAGVFGTSDDQFSKKVGELRAAGIFVTVSAGNSGPTASTITSPASGADSIAVGAIDPMQTNGIKSILDLSDDVICEFSSRGPVEGIYPKPDFVAPGESIIGPWLTGDKVASGTSMAAPFMAAGAVQVIAADKTVLDLVKLLYGGKTYNDIIESSFVDSAYNKEDRNSYGWGIPNIEAAVKIAWIKAVYALIVFIIATLTILFAIIFAYRLSKGKRRRI